MRSGRPSAGARVVALLAISLVVLAVGAAKALTTTTMQNDIDAVFFDQRGLIAGIYDRWFGAFGRPSPALQSMYLLNGLPE